MNRKFVLAMAITVAIISGAQILRASDPVGIYAVIEKVVFEPNENESRFGARFQSPRVIPATTIRRRRRVTCI